MENHNPLLNFARMGEGEPLVILHGLFGSNKNWQSLSKFFSQYFDVLALDLRNHGESFHSDVIDYPSMVNDLHYLLNQLEIKSCRLLGHSMGGKVAMLYALQYPQLVSQLVVADIAPIAYQHNFDHLIDPIMSLKLDEMDTRSDVDKALKTDISDPQLRQFLLQSLSRKPDGWCWKNNWSAIKKHFDKIIGFQIPEEAQSGSWKVNIPTLFISGELSDYVDEIGKDVINHHFEKPLFRIINSANHWLHAEQPKQFTDAVMNFFRN